MRKSTLFLLMVVVSSMTATAQNPPRRLGSTYLTPNDTSGVLNIRERIVQLALQNPNFEIADRRVSIASYQLNRAKGEWLSAITPSVNLNELTLQPKGTGNQFLPLWNVSVAIPLNYYTQRKNEVRVARENLYIAEAEKNEKYRQIRLQVLTKYEDYLMYKDILDLQSRVTQDAYLNYRQKEQDFKDDLLTVDVYNSSFALYAEQQRRRRLDERNFIVSKYDLEQMIGITVDELLQKK